MNAKPHKFKSESVDDVGWMKSYNPKLCSICKKHSGHPLHQKKYRNKPIHYQLEVVEKKITNK